MNVQRSRAGVVALSVVGLLVATTGGATAGALITGRQIQDGTVTGRDIHSGSVTGADVKDGSLTRHDFEGSLEGPQGAPGPAGAMGPAGPQGRPGVSGYEHQIAAVAIAKGQVGHQEARCSAGRIAVGGGISSSTFTGVRVVESAPLDGGIGWTAGLRNDSAGAVTAYVWAVCVNPS